VGRFYQKADLKKQTSNHSQTFLLLDQQLLNKLQKLHQKQGNKVTFIDVGF
jgi:hypothetical protein